MTAGSTSELEQFQLNAQQAAQSFRLPFRRRAWHGLQGNWQGTGTGSSLDFQDHRPYTAGDDPRYINWQAYARSGSYTMKLYRQEVSPALDLLIDVSPSMFNDERKRARTSELVYWAFETAAGSGANVRVYRWSGMEIELLALDEIISHRWQASRGLTEQVAGLPDVPWRHGSLRAVVTDLLWPGDAASFMQRITEGNGFAVVLCPFSKSEAEPDWAGNIEMVDCETSTVRAQRVDDGLLERYRKAYRRHFGIWEEAALRYRVPFARLSAELSLAEALRVNAGETGAVEWAS